MTPPPGVHAGVWSIVALAAIGAVEAARRRQSQPLQQQLARHRAELAAEIASFSVHSFWYTLSEAARAPLSPAWRAQVLADHPFLWSDAAASCWMVRQLAL